MKQRLLALLSPSPTTNEATFSHVTFRAAPSKENFSNISFPSGLFKVSLSLSFSPWLGTPPQLD